MKTQPKPKLYRQGDVLLVRIESLPVGDAGAKELHRDDYGTLYRAELPGDEPLVMVKVVNSTAEPDGSFKDYFLRVPPQTRTAREAVAWTFEHEPADYELAQQT